MASRNKGTALIAAMLAISLFSALGLALSLSSAVDRMAAANHEDAVHLLNMADAGWSSRLATSMGLPTGMPSSTAASDRPWWTGRLRERGGSRQTR